MPSAAPNEPQQLGPHAAVDHDALAAENDEISPAATLISGGNRSDGGSFLAAEVPSSFVPNLSSSRSSSSPPPWAGHALPKLTLPWMHATSAAVPQKLSSRDTLYYAGLVCDILLVLMPLLFICKSASFLPFGIASLLRPWGDMPRFDLPTPAHLKREWFGMA
jgi:hypothetical protein